MSPEKKSTESEAAARKAATLTFTVPFEGKPDKSIDMAIYAFSREGELLASAPVRDGRPNCRCRTRRPNSPRS